MTAGHPRETAVRNQTSLHGADVKQRRVQPGFVAVLQPSNRFVIEMEPID